MSIFERIIASITPKRYASGKRYDYDRGIITSHFGFKFTVQFGPGAGYVKWNEDRTHVLVTGRTFYLAWRSGSREWAMRYAGRRSLSPLEIGLTNNANKVPWMSH